MWNEYSEKIFAATALLLCVIAPVGSGVRGLPGRCLFPRGHRPSPRNRHLPGKPLTPDPTGEITQSSSAVAAKSFSEYFSRDRTATLCNRPCWVGGEGLAWKVPVSGGGSMSPRYRR